MAFKSFLQPETVQPQFLAALPPQFNITAPGAASQLRVPDMSAAISAIERQRGSRVICMCYSERAPVPGLAFPAAAVLEQVLTQLGRVPKLDLVFRNSGGSPEAAWRLISILREFTDHLTVIVSRFALSAGCYFAMAADELVLSPFAALSPVDLTRQHALLPKDGNNQPIAASVQDYKSCIQMIREQLGNSPSQGSLVRILPELFSYINPLALGALEQSYNLSRLITRKALQSRRNKLDEPHIQRIVDQLTGQYFSHDFQISRADVENDLGLPVAKWPDELMSLVANLENQCSAVLQRTVVLSPEAQDSLGRAGALLQTTQSGWAIMQILKRDGAYVSDAWLRFR